MTQELYLPSLLRRLQELENKNAKLEMVIAVARLVDKENLQRFAYDKELRTALAALDTSSANQDKG